MVCSGYLPLLALHHVHGLINPDWLSLYGISFTLICCCICRNNILGDNLAPWLINCVSLIG